MKKKKLKRNLFDRVVEVLSPEAALNRYSARLKIDQARGLYDGSATTRRMRPGIKKSAAPKNEAKDTKILAERALNLIRNDAYAKRGRNVLQAYATSTGIKATIRDARGNKNPEMQSVWNAWAGGLHCDQRRKNNFYGLQRLAFNSMVVTGEALIARNVNRDAAENIVPLSLHVMESANLDISKHNDRNEIYGVRFNGKSQPEAYYILPDPSNTTGEWISASEIIHLYDEDRAGQVRGISWFAPVILNIQDLGDYRDSERVRRKVAACFSAFVKPGLDQDFDSAELDTFSKIEPGAINILSPGQDVTFSSPPESRDYDPYVRVETQMIASGLGCTYEHLSQSLKDVNFSSAKIGQIPFKKQIEVWQELILRPKFLDPVFEWFKEYAIIQGFSAFEGATVEWTYPNFEMLDEEKETDALAAKVRYGFLSMSEAIRSQGYDPDEVLTEWATDQALLESLGVRVDSIPKWFTKAGIAQAENPAD